MLLVVSHFSVSRPLLTNLPSFPLGQTTFSTPGVPVGLGSFPGLVPSHHLQPATAAGPTSATCGERAVMWALPGEALDQFFSWFLEFSLLLNFSELDLPSCLAKDRWFYWFSLSTQNFTGKLPNFLFSKASRVLVLWLCCCPPCNSPPLTSQTSRPGLHPPTTFDCSEQQHTLFGTAV